MRARAWALMTVIILALVLPAGARAGVNLKNGNFYITYTDMIVGQPEFEIARTYNSKAVRVLSFGFGWGSDLDTYLNVVGDGTVVLHENGSGARRYYSPPRLTAAERETVVENMVLAMETAGWLTSDAQRAETRAEISQNAAERRRLYTKLAALDLVPERDLAVGERLTSTRTNEVFIVKEPGGYYRRSLTGFDRFNEDGQLVEVSDQNGEGFKLRRDNRGHLLEILPSNGARILVTTDTNGQIVKLASGEETATFEYDATYNLISATNAVGSTYRYEYDARHNMRFIRYEDGSYLETRYDNKEQFVSLQRKRDGSVTRYDYGKNPITQSHIVNHYYTRTHRYHSETDDTPFSDRTLTYQIGRDRHGNTYTAGIIETGDGRTRTRLFHPCRSPILIEEGDKRSEFDYDDNCRMIFKKTNSEQIKLQYDARHSKITRVETIDFDRDRESWSDFEYDLRGNLTLAQDHRGRRAKLAYDGTGLITRMEDEDGQVMTFAYGPLRKPTVIAIQGLGEINVSYDDSGEIDGVKSDQGHEMALRVTQAFQGLLSLVKPAGVNFDL